MKAGTNFSKRRMMLVFGVVFTLLPLAAMLAICMDFEPAKGELRYPGFFAELAVMFFWSFVCMADYSTYDAKYRKGKSWEVLFVVFPFAAPMAYFAVTARNPELFSKNRDTSVKYREVIARAARRLIVAVLVGCVLVSAGICPHCQSQLANSLGMAGTALILFCIFLLVFCSYLKRFDP